MLHTCATHSVTHLFHMCGTCVAKHLLSHEIQVCATPMLHMCSFGGGIEDHQGKTMGMLLAADFPAEMQWMLQQPNR